MEVAEAVPPHRPAAEVRRAGRGPTGLLPPPAKETRAMAFDLSPFTERRRRFAEAIGDALAIVPAARDPRPRRLS